MDYRARRIARCGMPAHVSLESMLRERYLETGSLHQALRRLGLHPILGSSVLTACTADDYAPEFDVDPTTPMLVETRSTEDQHPRLRPDPHALPGRQADRSG
ncbi:hypothetical protein [Streptomyces sp. 6-11-2]|uniref:hypothetical protein n=1 Tax=Streptomyces sp. 6-11-2 TaxID=2585753 RepID=UPI00114219C2|nr:hypothetical protein [Streptomyces sp. 6-11-2]